MVIFLTEEYKKVLQKSPMGNEFTKHIKGDFYREALLYNDRFYKSILLKSIVKTEGVFKNMIDNKDIKDTTLITTYYFSDISLDGICGYMHEDFSFKDDYYKLSEVLTTGYVTKNDGSIVDIGLSTYLLSEGGDTLVDGTILESTHMGITEASGYINPDFPSMILNPKHLTYENKIKNNVFDQRNMLLANSFVNEFSYDDIISKYKTSVHWVQPKIYGVKTNVDTYTLTPLNHFFIELSKILILHDVQHCNILFSPKNGFNLTYFTTSLDNNNTVKFNYYYCLINLLIQEIYNDHIKGIYHDALLDKCMVYDLTPLEATIKTSEFGNNICVSESRINLFSSTIDSYVYELINKINNQEQKKII